MKMLFRKQKTKERINNREQAGNSRPKEIVKVLPRKNRSL